MAISPVPQINDQAVTSNAVVKAVNQEGTQSKPQPIATDTVKLSSAAQAALQEATETTVQTDKEARSGDVQAQNIVARDAAEAARESSAGKGPKAPGMSVSDVL